MLVPNVGFRLATGALTSENVVATRGRETLTAQISSDRDGTDLRITVDGVDEELDFRKSRPVDAPVTVTDDRGQVVAERPSRFLMNSCFFRLMEGPTKFQRFASFDRLDPAVRSVDVAMTGGAGAWHVALPLSPVEHSGSRGTPIAATAVAHDIAIRVTAVARTPTLTAIEIETHDLRRPESLPIDQVERWIEGISALQWHRGLGQELLMLRDSTGQHHLEQPRAIQDQARPGRRREVVLFEGLPADAVTASLEVPFIAVRERSDELRVPVPGDTEIEMNGCRARVSASRVDRSSDSVPEHPSPVAGLNGPCVRFVIAPVDSEAERQLVMVGVMESNDRGMNVSRTRADPPVVEVPDPAGDASFLTFKNPVIRLGGPWRLECPLPPA